MAAPSAIAQQFGRLGLEQGIVLRQTAAACEVSHRDGPLVRCAGGLQQLACFRRSEGGIDEHEHIQQKHPVGGPGCEVLIRAEFQFKLGGEVFALCQLLQDPRGGFFGIHLPQCFLHFLQRHLGVHRGFAFNQQAMMDLQPGRRGTARFIPRLAGR